jgi:hypothetical protein
MTQKENLNTFALLNSKDPAKEFESSPYPPTFKIPDQCRDLLVE